MNPVTRTELAKRLGCSRSTVSRHLAKHIAHNPALAHDMFDNLLGSKLQFLIGHSIKHGFEQFLIDEETENQALLSDDERKENRQIAKSVAAIRATFKRAIGDYEVRDFIYDFIRNKHPKDACIMQIYDDYLFDIGCISLSSNSCDERYIELNFYPLKALGENGLEELLSHYEDTAQLRSKLIEDAAYNALSNGIFDLWQGIFSSRQEVNMPARLLPENEFERDERKPDVIECQGWYREY